MNKEIIIKIPLFGAEPSASDANALPEKSTLPETSGLPEPSLTSPAENKHNPVPSKGLVAHTAVEGLPVPLPASRLAALAEGPFCPLPKVELDPLPPGPGPKTARE